jgi:DNA-directed DNA polymerase III PolC
MIHLRNRTEYSFGTAVGRVSEVLQQQEPDAPAAITDRHGTWGHVRWSKACAKSGHKAIFGVELAVIEDVNRGKERQLANFVTLLARNNKGLKEMYELVTLATEHFYYIPRIDYSILGTVSKNLVVLSGLFPEWKQMPKHTFVEINQMSNPLVVSEGFSQGFQPVATQDNLFPHIDDLSLYQVIVGIKGAQMRTAPSHILQEWEWRLQMDEKGFSEKIAKIALANAQAVAKECNVKLPMAKMVKPKVSRTLEHLCHVGIHKRKLKMTKEYDQRLKRELDLINEKKFQDYFYVVTDMITYAKKHMLVGPARGSSCGSLVCYLLGITDIDPIEHGLLFERFIDVNREDYPDVDIDFQDDKREMVFEYLRDKYGHDNVARLGTISVFKARSALTVASKELKIPIWEVEEFKNSIVERSSGDSRAGFCIMDTFEQLPLGQQLIAKYPELKLSERLEGHASHTGMHAAGIVITADKVTNYCPVHNQSGNVMLDKFDAEDLQMLKIDCLGLRTLSTIQDTLDTIGWTREQLINHPKDDKKAFAVLTNERFSGIFQFEGFAVQSVTKQFQVETFEDVANLTALARPGPLSSGGTEEFVKRRTGKAQVSYMHPLVEEITKSTYGVIVYQEQVMQIARTVGALSWEDVSQLRKAMSKSYGKEYFDNYWKKFWEGAKNKGIKESKAQEIWSNINTYGSWAFNRSHAIAYGTISYWCCVLKAYFPLEYGAACLRNAKDSDQSIKLLRELVKEGYDYKPFDPALSLINWSVSEGKLIGGLIGIIGVGPKLAENILRKRATHGRSDTPIPFSKREIDLLNNGKTPYDHVFEAQERFGHIFANPKKHGITTQLSLLKDITAKDEGTVVFIAKLIKKDLRDHNDHKSLAKRGGRIMAGDKTMFMNAMVEDDTGNILVSVNRFDFDRWGRPLIDTAKIGDWFVWKGELSRGMRRVKVNRWKSLSNPAVKPL